MRRVMANLKKDLSLPRQSMALATTCPWSSTPKNLEFKEWGARLWGEERETSVAQSRLTRCRPSPRGMGAGVKEWESQRHSGGASLHLSSPLKDAKGSELKNTCVLTEETVRTWRDYNVSVLKLGPLLYHLLEQNYLWTVHLFPSLGNWTENWKLS